MKAHIMKTDLMYYQGRNEVIRLFLDSHRTAQQQRIVLGNRMCAVLKLLALKTYPRTSRLMYPSLYNTLLREGILKEITDESDTETSDEIDGDAREDDIREKKEKKALVSAKIAGLAMPEYKKLLTPTGRLVSGDRFETILAREKFTIIVNYDLALLMQNWYRMVDFEIDALATMKKAVQYEPLHDIIEAAKEADPLDFRGVGDMVIAVISGYIDFAKVYYPSWMISYVGIDVVDGVGRGRIKEHLVERTYIDKNKQEKTRMGLSFNPVVKTYLVGIAAGNIIRAGKGNPDEDRPNSYLYDIYANYKNRITQRENQVRMAWEEYTKMIEIHGAPEEGVSSGWKCEQDLIYFANKIRAPWTPKHIDAAAKRYMIRRLLIQIYNLYVPKFSNLVWQETYENRKFGPHTQRRRQGIDD